jgi:hypothetical protein
MPGRKLKRSLHKGLRAGCRPALSKNDTGPAENVNLL